MSHPESQPDTVDCLFTTILNFLLPFYLVGAGCNADIARVAIADLVEAYDAATTRELDLAGRLIGYSAAAMDNLRLSMRADLSDRKILQYRSNAVALGRLTEQSRLLLEAMQTRRQQAHAQHPMPQPRPAPVAPPKPSAPPHGQPPAQPHASAHPQAPAYPQALAYPASAVEGDPQFTCDMATMKHNMLALLADLQGAATALEPNPDQPAKRSAI
jgi:hypothetical protein